MKPPNQSLYSFGAFLLDPVEKVLSRDDHPVHLPPKAFETLLALVEKEGHVLEKAELLNRVWPNTFVEEATLAQNIFTLRKALGDGTNGREYIETVPKRGYRFVAPVKVAEEQEVGTHRKPTTIRGPLSQWLLWVAPVFLVAIVSVGIYLRGRPHGPASTTGPAKVMLAVLPFENLSGDAKQEYFSDGLATTAARRPGRTRP